MVLVTACGRGIDAGQAHRGEFEVYFQRFLTYAKEHGRTVEGAEVLRIEFDDLRSTEVGRCETGFLQGRIVYVDRSRWLSMNDLSKEALILHELGHCLLDRSHTSERFPADDRNMPGLPVSLMYPYATAGSRYQKYKDYYLNELFSQTGLRHAASCQGDD